MLVFLRFNELAFLCCCDVRFCDEKYVELFIAKSKTDIYRNGKVVVLAKTGNITCPVSLLSRYVQVGNIDLSSDLKFLHTLYFFKSVGCYRLKGTGIPVLVGSLGCIFSTWFSIQTIWST